jgi:hypothetical protein
MTERRSADAGPGEPLTPLKFSPSRGDGAAAYPVVTYRHFKEDLMRNVIAAAAILLGCGLVIVSPTPVLAQYGAIAWDRETGKYGASWNQPSPQKAAEAALGDCGTSGCKVIIRTRQATCAALATTENGKYAGGASRRDRDAARLAALKNCQKGNAGECTLRVTDCNK